ncbi:carbon monoxide dehydrogenase [Halobacteriales archaeon QS_8_69_26]|nr:MAG: carbon monoxide dehydrogenase [Halobacteriales archaeon QS_8_69_26]
MEFNGTFELSDATIDEVWLALSDPVMVREALPGCQFLLKVDSEDPDFDELRKRAEEEETQETTVDPEVIRSRAFEEGDHYAAVMSISVGSVNPTFETVVTIDERDKPKMNASGEGSSGNSSFEMSSGMELVETDGGVAVEWWAEADVFGRIAQMGQRVVNPVANRVVKRFFGDIRDRIEELKAAMHEDAESESGAEASTDGETATSGDRDSGDDSGSKGGIVARIKRLLGLGG